MARQCTHSAMTFAVVICTLRRPNELDRTLRSIAAADPPRGSWRVLVVDNAVDAATAAVVDSFRDRLPIERVVEPTAGLSRARNRALIELENEPIDHILWTDDDVVVGRGWLRAYETAFGAHPDAAFFGGPIEPVFEGRPPRWLTDHLDRLGTAFAYRAVPEGTTILAGAALPFGANYAVRAAEQFACRYDPRLGRQPGRWLIGSEETDLLEAICAAGQTGRWIPEAGVEHRVDRRRQTVSYLRRYYTGGALTHHLRSAVRPGRRAAMRAALGAELRYRRARLSRRPERWLPALLHSCQRFGALVAAMRNNSTWRR